MLQDQVLNSKILIKKKVASGVFLHLGFLTEQSRTKKVAARREKRSQTISHVLVNIVFRMDVIEDEGRNCIMDLQKEKQ